MAATREETFELSGEAINIQENAIRKFWILGGTQHHDRTEGTTTEKTRKSVTARRRTSTTLIALTYGGRFGRVDLGGTHHARCLTDVHDGRID
jgi:hypothetical protein